MPPALAGNAPRMALRMQATTGEDSRRELGLTGIFPLIVGKYHDEMKALMRQNGKPTNPDFMGDSLFICGAGGHGWIEYHTHCDNGCGYDNGEGGDYCA
jgi:hypothetical protein